LRNHKGSTTMPTPIALSDAQMNAILAAATPLQPRARQAFLREVAQLLQSEPALGDGSLHRLLVVVQRKHFDAPDLRGAGGHGKYE
jgi:hypothetical protein